MDTVERTIKVKTSDGEMPCHLALPASGGPFPSLIVFMEAFGLNNNIKKITSRFAAEGFVAIAPDLYFRQPDNVASYNDLPKALRLMATLDDDKVVADTEAVIAFLKTLKEAKQQGVGTVGFCMGGRIAFLTACRISEEVKAAVPFYGGGMVSPRQPGQKPPIEYVGNLKAPVLAFFGGKDQFIPRSDVETFQARLKEAGKSLELVLYEDADHGFMCDERSSFHPTHAQEAWRKTVDFFRRHLG